ncbi:MAG: hypothetical protein JNJ57_21300 [Saprospiraceae bacterium]|nr:hypothetical protein [Saprospiraceae bacterium]
MPKPYLFLLFLILANLAVKAQDPDQARGYCITTSGDSISGILYTGEIWQGVIRIQKTKQNDWLSFKPTDLQKAGRKDGVTFFPHFLVHGKDTLHIFIQQILKGGYQLYEGKSTTLTPLFFLNSKDQPNLTRINERAVEIQLNTYFGDCAKSAKIKPFYEKERLQRFVKVMNDCAYPKQTASQKSIKIKPYLSGSIYAGANQHTATQFFAYFGDPLRYEGSTFISQPKPTVGLNLFFNINPIVSIFTGAHYILKEAKADSASRFSDRGYPAINPNTGEPYTLYARFFYKYQNHFQAQYLECPIGFRVRLSPLSSQGFQALGGITFSFPISKFKASGWGLPYKVEAPLSLTPKPTLEEARVNDRLFSLKQPQIGLFLGAGWHWKLNKQNSIAAILQFHWAKETVLTALPGGLAGGSGHLDFESKRIQLGIGWEFSKKRQ